MRSHNKIRRFRKFRIIVFLAAILAIAFLLWQFAIPYVQYSQRQHMTVPKLSKTNTASVSAKGLYSQNAILIRRKDGQVLMDKNSKQKIYPASMTKIMTVTVALKKLPFLNQKITLSKDIFDQMQRQDASMAGFQAGEQVQANDLMYGALLPSGAECCLGLARTCAGSQSHFADLMNQEATQIGMSNTHFVTSTGLHNQNHYSTVKDMALLLDYALRDSTFRKIFTTHSHQSNGIVLNSTLFNGNTSTSLPSGKILGGKTGYTSEAGHCLASLATIDNQEYICVTAHAPKNGQHIADAVTIYSKLK